MANIKGQIRRSQVITTYGVGAVVAVEDESFMVSGIDRWQVSEPDIHEPRLERELRVEGFVQPPATERGADLPVVRFPTYESCPGCKRLNRHRFFTTTQGNKCNVCDRPLVPSRFIVACENGHADDFPYFQWVHKGTKPQGEPTTHDMYLDAAGASASLRDVVIRCSCGKASTMEGSFARTALEHVWSCSGRRPWLTDGAPEPCGLIPRTLQRGASNAYFPIVRSAISIPPWSDSAFKALNKIWFILRSMSDEGTLRAVLEPIAAKTEFSVDDLLVAVRRRKDEEAGTDVRDPNLVRAQEFEALSRGKKETSREQDFVCVPAPVMGDLTAEWFQQVMLVTRLREVRVLESFTRLLPPGPGDPPERRAALYLNSTNWLPGIEVLGEGVFMRLKEDLVEEWEGRPSVRRRVETLIRNYERRSGKGSSLLGERTITPRLLLVHSLAHSLINQWALECGYPAAALRERLYVSDSMAALMIYTATTDSAGSLGGIVGQADAKRLDQALVEAIARSAWCSADPLCIESEATGVESLNLAACHACLLLPEVSCEESNLFLDRGLLVGTPDSSDVGLFAKLTS